MGANFGTYTTIAGVLYDAGSGNEITINNGALVNSVLVNFSDFGVPGSLDFSDLGPGSQCWYLAYGVRFDTPPAPPTDVLGAHIAVESSLDKNQPFSGFVTERIILPVQANAPKVYQGYFRMDVSSGLLTLFNDTGVDLVTSWSFWGKAF